MTGRKYIVAVLFVVLALIQGSLCSCKKMESRNFSAKKTVNSEPDRMPIAPKKGEASAYAPQMANKANADFAEESKPAPAELKKIERKVIVNATLTLEVKQLDSAVEEITKIGAEYGGYIIGSDVQTHKEQTYNGGLKVYKSGTMTLRVPQKDFNTAYARVKKLGNVEKENIKGDDVTDEYVDVQSRLRNLQNEEARFNEILLKAKTIDEIMTVEEQIRNVREQIELLTGRIQYMDNLSAMATLTVEMSEKATPIPPPPAKPPRFWGLPSTVKHAITVFLAVLKVALKMIIWVAVFSPYILIPFILILIIRKIIRGKKKS